MQKPILTDSMMCVVLLSPPSMSTVVLLASLKRPNVLKQIFKFVIQMKYFLIIHTR